MSMEIRKHLEVELLAALKQTTSPHLDLKASKNKLGLLVAKEKLGEIYVQHLTKADGYYASPQAISATVQKITERLEKFYLPKAEHCVLGTPALIDDVLAEPDNYAFPFLAIVFAAHKNNLSLDSDVLKKALATKAIFGNKQFDLALANKLLGAG